jgi:hypothetical protein
MTSPNSRLSENFKKISWDLPVIDPRLSMGAKAKSYLPLFAGYGKGLDYHFCNNAPGATKGYTGTHEQRNQAF